MVCKTIKRLASLTVAVTAVLFVWTWEAASEQISPDFFISASTGFEVLRYSEKLKERGIDSDATSVNMIGMVNAEKNWKGLNVSGSAVFPLYSGDCTESWREYSHDYQTNRLRYSLYRMDARFGYAIRPWLVPCAGIRWSEAIQKRDEFMVTGSPYAGSARETVTSIDLSLGFKGEISLNPKWRVSWLASWYTSLENKVENSFIPETVIRSVPSYTLETELEAIYTIAPHVSIGSRFTGGWIHRSGSPWVNTSLGQSSKYPENDTSILGLVFTSRFEF